MTFTGENSSPTIWATSIIFVKMAKVNRHPIGKNSPNLVALRESNIFLFRINFPEKNLR
jgi:hypothetical protein